MNNTASLSTRTFDLDGAVFLSNLHPGKSELSSWRRRANRIATLDGGAYIDDLGYSPADRTIILALVNPVRDVVDSLQYLVKNYAELTLVIPDGAYKGMLNKVEHTGGDLRAEFLISSVT